MDIGVIAIVASFFVFVAFLFWKAWMAGADEVPTPRILAYVPYREPASWWCLGKCESQQEGERPEDGLCEECREYLQEVA